MFLGTCKIGIKTEGEPELLGNIDEGSIRAKLCNCKVVLEIEL
jgi:hypothetical protein